MASAEQFVQQFTQAVQSGNVSSITGLFASNLQHNLDRSGIKTDLNTPSALAQASKNFGDAKVKILDTVVSGDNVVVRFQFNVDGSHVAGAKPGSKATVSAVCVARLENGKVVDAKIEQDVAGMLLQLGFGVADAH